MSKPRWSTWRWALGAYLPVTSRIRPPWRRTAARASWAPGNASVGGDRVVGVQRAEAVTGGVDGVRGQVVAEQVVERRAEVRGHVGGREVDAELAAERREGGAEAGHGVDQRHVEIEADDELVHVRSVGARR